MSTTEPSSSTTKPKSPSTNTSSLEESVKKLSLADLIAQQKQQKESEKDGNVSNKKDNAGSDEEGDEGGAADETSPDVYFEPIVHLSPVKPYSPEDEEQVLWSSRAKLYRFDASAGEWKERGIGDLKIVRLLSKDREMQSSSVSSVRILMRREQTLKLCANHLITAEMSLASHGGSDRAWVWTTLADISGEPPEGSLYPIPQKEVFAARFQGADTAKKFKEEFEKVQQSFDTKNEEEKDESEKKEEKPEPEQDKEKTKSEEQSEKNGKSNSSSGDKQ